MPAGAYSPRGGFELVAAVGRKRRDERCLVVAQLFVVTQGDVRSARRRRVVPARVIERGQRPALARVSVHVEPRAWGAYRASLSRSLRCASGTYFLSVLVPLPFCCCCCCCCCWVDGAGAAELVAGAELAGVAEALGARALAGAALVLLLLAVAAAAGAGVGEGSAGKLALKGGSVDGPLIVDARQAASRSQEHARNPQTAHVAAPWPLSLCSAALASLSSRAGHARSARRPSRLCCLLTTQHGAATLYMHRTSSYSTQEPASRIRK